MTFGQILKSLREERDMKQEDICAALNIEQSTLSNYENDRRKPKLELAVKVADFFNVSLDYLLGRTERTLVGHDEEKFFFFFPVEHPPLSEVVWQRKTNLENLSKQTGISVEALGNCYDKYVPTYTELSAIATALNTSTDFLLGRTDEITPPNSEEQALIRYYRNLSEIDRHVLLGKAAELVKKQNDESVAADPSEASSGKVAK